MAEYLHGISLRRQCSYQGKILEDFTVQKVGFPWRRFGQSEAASDVSHKESKFNTCLDDPANVNHWELLFATCLDSLANVNHRELLFATYPDGPTNANHREHLFATMFGHKSENCKRRSFSLQPSEC
jgi:hypothetical protein